VGEGEAGFPWSREPDVGSRLTGDPASPSPSDPPPCSALSLSLK